MNSIILKLRPAYCNRWPELTVSHNNKIIFKNIIDCAQQVSIEYTEENNNIITVGMSNKHFGEDNIWDTKTDEKGNILEDLTLTLEDALICDISIKEIFLKNMYLISKSSGPELLDDKVYSNGTMNFNGYFKFEYRLPLISSIINQKFKLPADHEKSYYSNYTTLFEYDQEIELIQDIERLLDEIKKLNS